VIDFDGNGLQWDFLSYPSCDQRLQAHIINYADDFVIFCHRKTAQAQAHRKDNGQAPKAIYWGTQVLMHVAILNLVIDSKQK
jgi:hypothetical protein